MDIRKTLEIRKLYPIGSRTTNVNEVDYITSVMESNENIIGLALPLSFLNRRHSDIETLKELIFDDWYISGIYDLSRIWYPYAGLEFNLICLSKTKPDKIRLSKYESSNTYTGTSQSNNKLGMVGKQTISDDYSIYLSELSYIIVGKKETFTEAKASLFSVPYLSLNKDHLSINYYHPDLIENQNKLDQEKTVILSELVDILIPKQDRNKICPIFGPANFNYPIQYNKMREGKATNITLNKGHILFSMVGNQRSFLIDEKPKIDISPSIHTLVLQCKSGKITPEYLFLYLQSDTVKKYVIRHLTGSVVNAISRKDLQLLPVIIPDTLVLDRSENLFRILFREPKDDTIERINNELFNPKISAKPIQVKFIKEFIKKSKSYKLGLIKTIIDDDLREIKQCVDANAYKSAIILCGSVLEAVLLDWLSEIDSKNYLVSDIDFSLFEMIKNLDRKGYFDRSLTDAAHSIRKQRNLIHPKVYFKSRGRIDKKSILKTINELKKILVTRL